jgi:hypothetical protein
MTDLATEKEEDFNDEKERFAVLTDILDIQVQCFPKVISKLIASYVILFNVTFLHPGLGKSLAVHPLSHTVPIWTIEVKRTYIGLLVYIIIRKKFY